MSEIDRILESCIECGLCVEECEFLKQTCDSPKDLARELGDSHPSENPRVPYSCNLCDLCERLCPSELNLGKACLEVRHHLASEGYCSLRSHQAVAEDREWSLSNFYLAMADPDLDGCDSVFFPGCTLSGYSPWLVVRAYEYLKAELPPTGIILACCGNPTYSLGQEEAFQIILREIQGSMERLGASQIIAACPECYHTLKYLEGLPVVSLYEVVAKQGLPETTPAGEAVFSLHDSCSTRYEQSLQESVRELVRQMGYRIEEMEYSRDMTRCCGMGGMAAYADPRLANKVTRKRAREAKHDILTYCASCREAFAMLGKPSTHVLDLIFNPDWEKERRPQPKTRDQRRENQALLKSQFAAGLKGG